MQDSFFIVFTIAVTIALIYFVYKIMLGVEKSENTNDLQITSNEILEQVNILYKQKKYNIAENLARKYLEKKPSDDGVRTILTKCLYNSKRTFDAIDQAQIIIRHQHKNHEMKIFLANCYMEITQSAKAISILRDILNDEPNNVVAIKELAKIYFITNQKRSAIKMYKRLEEFLYSNQEKANNKKLLAQMHLEFQEYSEAIAEYNGILEIYPADIDIKRKLVELYELTGDYSIAIEQAQVIFDQHATNEADLWALQKMSNLYLQIKDYDKALEIANLIKDNALADKVKASEHIAKILMETGQIDESIELLKNISTENPHNTAVKRTLAKAYSLKDDFDSTANIYKKILDDAGIDEIKQIHFEMSNIYSDWAVYLYNQKDNAECFKKFTIAIQYDSENPDIYYRLGMINKTIKNFNEAIIQFKKAIELNRTNPSYYYEISECYAAIDNVNEEKKALIECSNFDPDNPVVFFKLAKLYENQHDLTKAVPALKKAIEINENYADAKYRLALILEGQGDREGAISLYQDIVEIDPANENAANNLKMLKGA